MKKFAAGILAALCATTFSIAQPIVNEQTVDSTTTTAAQTSNDSTLTDEQYIPPQKRAHISVGAKASFIYGNFWGFKDLKNDGIEEPSGFGGEFGVAARFRLIDGLQFSPELAFRFLNLNHKDEDTEETRHYDQMFIDLTFNLRGEITKNFYLEVGPQLSINISSDYEIDGNSEFENIEQSPIEFGINIGAGYYVVDNVAINFRWYTGFNEVFPDVKFRGDLGINDYEKGNTVKSNIKWSMLHLNGAHTMMFKFGVTYWFI